MLKISLAGGRDLERALAELKTATAKSVMRRVLKKSGEPLAGAMNRYAPEGAGEDQEPGGHHELLEPDLQNGAEQVRHAGT